MASANLLALIDDIATLMDDIAAMSKVAAKKTAGVLGDDLALNANQVQGVKADRELPVVWAVAKGSLLNKVILVPSALLISAFFPPLITLLLIAGGLFLCFEGSEKVLHRFISGDDHEREERLSAASHQEVDMVAFEKEKIKGAIRTDFILSAEIIVIALGSVQKADIVTQLGVLIALSIGVTVGVYGLVAGLVKMDDAGLYMLRKSFSGGYNTFQKWSGRALLIAAPALMRLLAIVGTIAMFLVGGGILTHNIGPLHHLAERLNQMAADYSLASALLFDAAFGFVAGALVLGIVMVAKKLKR